MTRRSSKTSRAPHISRKTGLEETVDLAHGGLDVERLDVLPLLLKKRDQEVDGKHDVGEQLVVGHLDVANGDTEAENLLELELDGALDLVDLLLEVLVVRDGGRELAGLGETGPNRRGICLMSASRPGKRRTSWRAS